VFHVFNLGSGSPVPVFTRPQSGAGVLRDTPAFSPGTGSPRAERFGTVLMCWGRPGRAGEIG
jgi:hypothetical protein